MLFKTEKKLKTKEKVSINIEQNVDYISNIFYLLSAKNNSGEEIGFVIFIMNKIYGHIMNIKVTNPQYLNKGLGSIMLKCIEDFVFLNGAKKVSGNFIPDIDEEKGYTEAAAYNLYYKHNYEFDDDDFYGTSIIKILTQLNYPDSKLLTENKEKELQ